MKKDLPGKEQPRSGLWLSTGAACLGLAALGLVGAEALNKAGWLPGRVIPWHWSLALPLFYLVPRLLLARRALSPAWTRTGRFLLGLAGLAALLAIPLLWWGVIRELAAAARRGQPFF